MVAFHLITHWSHVGAVTGSLHAVGSSNPAANGGGRREEVGQQLLRSRELDFPAGWRETCKLDRSGEDEAALLEMERQSRSRWTFEVERLRSRAAPQAGGSHRHHR